MLIEKKIAARIEVRETPKYDRKMRRNQKKDTQMKMPVNQGRESSRGAGSPAGCIQEGVCYMLLVG